MDREAERKRDASLVLAGLKGDKKALQELVDYYHGPVYNIAFRILNDVDASADTTQTTFLLVFEKLHTFNPEFKFFSWVYRIAVNEALDYYKKQQRFESRLVEAAIPSESGGPEEKMYNVELSRAIQQMLMKLQEDYRSVIVLRHFMELSYDEMAEVLDIPVKTVRSRLYSARQILKSALQSEEFCAL
ncbi:MAG TPA: sigma-70 family RNA polymerase sigma factor [Pseudomonadales bacterium]|jgi:RNA polymerase sigma-70 factor (ECF subfamily)|nr:hypothetical protein [Gammaproteobacteria bacterium]MDP6025807.1 sigma-70 family RNA polymerase sigma factor [Pseudomonadales bacterium]MDP6314922.1 sigma-70 family RNA polymerase sigma factor [Pseudomonadales bacterium]MDP7314800.1 sigma-70 family RNA polymerase sigma factor [Pseudomonadales bacterium]HJL60983.1 sigma-70 family RNA polymerase sigma factor [Pseudomonadales bacterium]|tara:strand:+ start:1054 stop:1617 length:564 start_codon:yes stop_codon:yes gene_type:complete